MRAKLFFGCMLSLCALVCMTAAASDLVIVEFYDENANLLSNCIVGVFDVDGQPLHKLGPQADGQYRIDVQPGQKVWFILEDRATGEIREADTYVPFDYVAPLEIQLGGQSLGTGGAPNDNCPAPIALAVPSTTPGSTTTAMTDPEAIAVGFCGTSVSDPSAGVWYTVIGTGNTITATTCNPGTDYDTKITVYCQDCDSLQCVGGNDDGSPLGTNPDPACVVPETGSTFNRASTVSWCSQAGAEYRVFVHGFTTATGNFELSLSEDGQSCSAEVACLATGACCNGSNCEITTESACNAGGGVYQGDDTLCFGQVNPFVEVSTPNLPIPDNNPTGVSDTINVTNSIVIGDLNVDIVVTHTFLGDLLIDLTHPSGSPVVTLWDNACAGNNDMDVLLDDGGADVVCGTPTTGTINATSVGGGALSAFNGTDSAGVWTLNISDNLAADIGTLNQWSLHFAESSASVCEGPQLGQCCQGGVAGNVCLVNTEAECMSSGQFISWEAGGTCPMGDASCEEAPLGQCCQGGIAGNVCLVNTEAECMSSGQFISWAEGGDCPMGDATCDEAPLGECCVSGSGGNLCEVNTEEECSGDPGFISWMEGGTCASGDATCDEPLTGRVTLCHIPPGNPANAHTITVGAAAVPAHLAHGDHLGPCQSESPNGDASDGGMPSRLALAGSTGVSQAEYPVTLDRDARRTSGPGARRQATEQIESPSQVRSDTADPQPTTTTTNESVGRLLALVTSGSTAEQRGRSRDALVSALDEEIEPETALKIVRSLAADADDALRPVLIEHLEALRAEVEGSGDDGLVGQVERLLGQLND